MQAIILAGGFGTRLSQVLPNIPKPMAPIAEKPFLAYLLDYLQQQGVTQVIFSVHHLAEQIQNYFNDNYHGLTISYVHEAKPLGTGGAMAYALSTMQTNQPIFVLNGDTFVQVDYRAMFAAQQQHAKALMLALRPVPDCTRYGKVITQDDLIAGFKEKGETGPGLINAGVYLLQPDLFSQFNLPEVFSFEQDFLIRYLDKLQPGFFIANDYFIDIGIPEDYARADRELPLLIVK